MRRGWLAALAVVLVTCVVYGPTLTDYPVQDDFGVLALLSSKPATYFPRWFVSTWMDGIWGYTPDEVRPFPAVSYQLTTAWGATHTLANHALNIALHAANGWLVLLVGMEALGLSLGVATVAAVLFAVLPIQTESVAWITGRVDSLPALFYVAGFLAWVRWRTVGGTTRYLSALGLLFLALFSKQNTITFVPALVAWDVLVHRERPWAGWQACASAVRVYLPFVLLTVAYLGLRYVLFGAVVREDTLAAQPTEELLQILRHHAERLVLGSLTAARAGGWMMAALGAAVVAVGIVLSSSGRRRAVRTLVFCVAWVVLGLAPVIVAGYESPRHAYLASVGWVLALGLAAEVLWRARPSTVWRLVTTGLVLALLATYTVQVAADVRVWHTRARVSQMAAVGLDRELTGLPDGTLVILGVPKRSWEWALPFVARPPYASRDHWSTMSIISERWLYCCRHEWEGQTRAAIARWAARPDRPPIVALFWDQETGGLSRLTSVEDSSLAVNVALLAQTPGDLPLDHGLSDLLRLLVAPRRVTRAAR